MTEEPGRRRSSLRNLDCQLVFKEESTNAQFVTFVILPESPFFGRLAGALDEAKDRLWRAENGVFQLKAAAQSCIAPDGERSDIGDYQFLSDNYNPDA